MRNGVAVLSFLLWACCATLAQRVAFDVRSECGVSQVHQTATIQDGGAHSVSLDQRECRFAVPLELGGVRFETYLATGTDDVQWNKAKDQGYAIGTSSEGSRYFLRYEGSSVMNGPVPVHLQGKWRFRGGSGKLEKLTGEGTYEAAPTPDGRMIFRLRGWWKL